MQQEPSADSPSHRRRYLYAAVILAVGITFGWLMRSCKSEMLIHHCLDNGGAWFDRYPGCVYEQDAFDCLKAGQAWEPGKHTCQ